MGEEIKPSDLWLQIMAMPRPSRVVDFPRTGADGQPIGQLRMMVLTQEEQIICSAEAERFTKKAIKDLPKQDDAQLGYENVYHNAAAVEILMHVCRQKDNPEKPFFPNCSAIRQSLTPDEVGVLMVQYYTTQAELGPIVASMTAEDAEAWIVRLGEGGSKFPLDFLSSAAVKDLAYILACQIHNSRTGTSSPGSLPEEPNETTPQQLPLPTISA